MISANDTKHLCKISLYIFIRTIYRLRYKDLILILRVTFSAKKTYLIQKQNLKPKILSKHRRCFSKHILTIPLYIKRNHFGINLYFSFTGPHSVVWRFNLGQVNTKGHLHLKVRSALFHRFKVKCEMWWIFG